MCYRPRPDLKPAPARKPISEDIDRKVQRLQAELALLRQQQGHPLGA
jgi:hypothetical protein